MKWSGQTMHFMPADPPGLSARMQPLPGRDFATMRIIVLGHQPGSGVRDSAQFSGRRRCLLNGPTCVR